MSGLLHPPRAPSDQVRAESFRALSRLQLIFEFRHWLQHLRDNVARRYDSPVILLWDCMSFGAPMGALLDLLGSPAPSELQTTADSFDWKLSIDDRTVQVESFIHRINMLQVEGRIPNEESLQVDDILGAGVPGYAKVLRVTNQILDALQASDPRVFVPPHGWKARRANAIQKLKDTERRYIAQLSDVSEASSNLYARSDLSDTCLETFIVNCSRLIPYHTLFARPLSKLPPSGQEIWDEIFMFTARPVSKLSQNILEVTLPTNADSYDSLCRMTFEMFHLTETINEVGLELRTMWAGTNLESRLTGVRAFSSRGLGSVLLDDRLIVDPATGLYYSVFLFQHIFLCCRERKPDPPIRTQYPLKAWEVGPALSASCQLGLVCAVPTKNFTTLHCIDKQFFELFWVDMSNTEQSMVFFPTDPAQYQQWISIMHPLVQRILHSKTVLVDEDAPPTPGIPTPMTLIQTGEEIVADTPRSTSFPWSAFSAVKSPTSPTKDLGYSSGESTPAQSAMLHTGWAPSTAAGSAFPLRSGWAPSPFLPKQESRWDSLDLSGEVSREGDHAVAHGGQSDTWAGKWTKEKTGEEVKVAIKVLRKSGRDSKKKLRLLDAWQRHLKAWHCLQHEHVLPLFGVMRDSGLYPSVICPWRENGSVSAYLESSGNSIQESERLRMHNILLDKDLKVQISDVGISSVMEEMDSETKNEMPFTPVSARSVARWRDSCFYEVPDGFGNGKSQWMPPPPTAKTDVYSLGSVMLEILSGLPPYHYIAMDDQVVIELQNGHLPQRPANSCISDAQWDFIQWCWTQPADARPDAGDVVIHLAMFREMTFSEVSI
ncbi:TKL/TKL-ccin protein kinase [Coprinopsis sp. MPI-PUGE-AT-0042]|nr:TKL/TKL-ccin protein kinase [Coprinopsis sp. MPI-PUGE-AT-0042]